MTGAREGGADGWRGGPEPKCVKGERLPRPPPAASPPFPSTLEEPPFAYSHPGSPCR